jgi:hypothetical protein
MAAISRPVTLLSQMDQRLGPYMMGNDATVDGDRTRTRFRSTFSNAESQVL